VAALQTGIRPDGRILSPVMPWRNFANMTKPDALAVAAFLKSLPAVKHQVPGPFGTDELPTIPFMKIVFPMEATSTGAP
jgi:hypothetical protein